MKRKVLGVLIVFAALVTPVAVSRPAVACNQCEEQAILNAIRCMASGPFWLC